MRIGLFTDSYFPMINGVSVSVFNLYEELKARGHSVFVFTHIHDVAEPDDCVIRFKAFKNPKRGLREFRIGFVTRKKIKKIAAMNLDVIHCHSEFTMGRVAKRAAKKLKIPFVYTYHTMYEDYTHYLAKRGTKILKKMVIGIGLYYANFADHVILPTSKVATKFASYGFTGPSSIIPTGIDLSRFKASFMDASKEPLKASIKRPYPHFIFVGRISHEKSIQPLIEAVSMLHAKQIKCYLTIVGDGPDKKAYEQFTRDQNLDEFIAFTGMVAQSEIPYYYQCADYFVSFSKTETQGLTYIEALASGTPVLAYKDDHLEEIIEPKVNGYLFKSPHEFVDLVSHLVVKDSAYTLDKVAIIDSVKAYDKAVYGQSLEKVYASLVNK